MTDNERDPSEDGSEYLASVVVPAHNEETTIGRCIRSIRTAGTASRIQIVVVANACTDNTASVARSLGAEVVEVSTPGKANALNMGDKHATAWPRIYIDADIEIDPEAIVQLTSGLGSSDRPLGAAPRLIHDLSGCSNTVRRYLEVWEHMRGYTAPNIGSGVYAMNRPARGLFEDFPNLISDDGFVDRLIARENRFEANSHFIVRPPRNVHSLITIKARRIVGDKQLALWEAQSLPEERPARSRRLLRSSLHGQKLLDLATYVAIQIAAHALAELRTRRGDLDWSVDKTSRS